MDISPQTRRLALMAVLAAGDLISSVAGFAGDDRKPAIEPRKPTIPNRDFPITQYGAKGDGVTLDTEAIRAAIAACAKAGGGRVIVPEGKFRSGPISLASHLALVLQKGAVLQASEKFSDFGLPDPLPATQAEVDGYRKEVTPLITGKKLEDVAIIGEGVIDGGGAPWWAKSDVVAMRTPPVAKPGQTAPPVRPLYVPRPHLVVLRDCERVLIQGVTLRNSPMFHFVPHHCHDVRVEDVTIFAPENAPNTDGIDPANSREVLIQRCTIDTGDDNIAMKGGGVGGEPTEMVLITNCKFLHGHGVSIGSETEAGVRDVFVENCSFENTGTALRIKSGRTRGGPVGKIHYAQIKMKNVDVPITISLFYDDRAAGSKPTEKPVTDTTPRIGPVAFTDITCDGALQKAGEIVGLPESPITGVVLERVIIRGAAAPFALRDVVDLETRGFEVRTVEAPAGSR
jgi:polygalacturonase